MNWVFVSILALSIGQTAVCGFGWTLLISYIGRLLFLLRAFGTVVPYKVSLGFEAAHLFFVALGIIFTKGSVDWWGALLSTLFGIATCLLYLIDDRFYLYVVADDQEEEER
jgi:hypothetical protein